jgi:AAA domain
MIFQWFDTVPSTPGELLRYLERADVELRSEIVGPSNGDDPAGEDFLKARVDEAEHQRIVTNSLNQGLIVEAHARIQSLDSLHQKFTVQISAGNAIDVAKAAEVYWEKKNAEGDSGLWRSALLKGGVSSLEISTLEIASRVVMIDDWCRVGDLGFIFAARGLGKTWLAMHLSKGLATKQNVGPWTIHIQCNVLYLDGEMAPDDIKFRDYALGEKVENLVYINHEILFSRTGKIMNLADPEFQAATLDHCQQKKFNVLCLDNLSTLASGVDENKTIDWEVIQPWLLKLRRIGVTVIFIHHAGRNNQMRGGSKREDPASWVIRLDEPYNGNEKAGAHFISRFTKWRGAKKQPKTYEWIYRPEIGGEILVEFKETSSIVLFRQMIDDGLDTCTAIAEEMGVSNGLVSRFATEAEKQGWLAKKGRKYVLVKSAK